MVYSMFFSDVIDLFTSFLMRFLGGYRYRYLQEYKSLHDCYGVCFCSLLWGWLLFISVVIFTLYSLASLWWYLGVCFVFFVSWCYCNYCCVRSDSVVRGSVMVFLVCCFLFSCTVVVVE